jgi:prepilin-type N-terminal cleavage/methylation domain-containing protein
MTGSTQQKGGFTLVEMLMALVVSVSVFMAMNVLLVNVTRLWVNGAGQWYLANQARVARARILSGGMGPGTGVLSMDELTSIKTNPNWCTIAYQTAGSTEKYWIRGSVENPASKDRAIFIKNNHGGEQTWLMMLGRKQSWKDKPEVESLNFDASLSGDVLTLRYDISFQSGGQVFEQPQIIRAHLVNL